MKVTQALLSDSDGKRYYLEIDGVSYKIHFRYNKLLCKIPRGLKTLRELQVGDTVSNVVYEKVHWDDSVYYILKSIDTE